MLTNNVFSIFAVYLCVPIFYCRSISRSLVFACNQKTEPDEVTKNVVSQPSDDEDDDDLDYDDAEASANGPLNY